MAKVFQNSAEHNDSDTSESVTFSKIQKNSVKTKKNSTETNLSRARNRKIFETRNSAGLIKLSTGLTELSAGFLNKSAIFENPRFSPLRRFE
jgi:hypothetical protein